jgi:probable HAF family extracellular repeat protein
LKQITILAAVVAVAVPAICSAASYTITQLGNPINETEPDAVFRPGSINASGQVAGALDGGVVFPGIFSDGVTHQLYIDGTEGVATSINDTGQVVGNTIPDAIPFLYDSGTVAYLGESQGLLGGRAAGINNNGDVVGYWFHDDNIRDAFVYSGGVFRDLNSLISPSSGWLLQDAQAINCTGQITGYGIIGGQQHAFLYSAGIVKDLGTLPGAVRYVGHALNACGQVVGEADFPDGSQHAFLYSNGSMHDLGPGSAIGINSSGEILGNNIIDETPLMPFVYIGGTRYDLDSLIDPNSAFYASIFRATGLNDSGQIVGNGENEARDTIAVLLTPTPEPSTMVLACLGFIGLAAWDWQRRKR